MVLHYSQIFWSVRFVMINISRLITEKYQDFIRRSRFELLKCQNNEGNNRRAAREWNWNKTFIPDKFPGKFVRLKVDTFYDYKPIWEWFVKTAGLFQFILYNYIMKLSLTFTSFKICCKDNFYHIIEIPIIESICITHCLKFYQYCFI